MELKGIKEFLEKYTNTLLRAEDERGLIQKCIKTVSGVSLNNKEFKIEKSEIVLHTTPIKKNQIFLYKKSLLEELRRHNTTTIVDIH